MGESRWDLFYFVLNAPETIRTSDLWFRRSSLKRYVNDSSCSVLFRSSRFFTVSGSYWTQIGPKFQSYSWDISGAEWIDDIDLMGEDLIVSDPKIMMGKPVIAGTRITVEIILDKLAAGETVSQILASHSRLTEESIRAALSFASQALKADVVYPLPAKTR
jgi:uncharacterized protein (DUF433 family)